MKKHNKNNSSKIFFHSSAKVCTVTYFNKSFSHAKKSPFSGRFFFLSIHLPFPPVRPVWRLVLHLLRLIAGLSSVALCYLLDALYGGGLKLLFCHAPFPVAAYGAGAVYAPFGPKAQVVLHLCNKEPCNGAHACAD